MISIVLAFVSLVTLWFLLIKPLSYWKNKGVRQGKPWPILGDSWRSIGGKTAYLNYINWMYDQAKGGRYFGLYQFFRPILYVSDPELIKEITVKEFQHFTDHSEFAFDAETDPHWGNNLLILKGQKWKDMRSTLSPNYTGSKMRIIYGLMVETCESFINFFLSKNQDVIELEMKDTFSRYTTDVIATTAFGIKVDSLKDPDNLFYYNGTTMANFQSIWRAFKVVLYNFAPITWKIFGFTHLGKDHIKFFHNALFDTIKQREEKDIFRPDLVHLLMELKKRRNSVQPKEGQILTDEEILAQALIFFFAGLETVSSILSFGTYELALNKEVQDKLREEIKEAYNKHGKPSYDVLQGMKYMDMVVSEILRKWPTFMVTDRRVTKPFTIKPVDEKETPLELDTGDSIIFPIFRLHRDPKYFPNPEKFDPERFSEKNKHNIHSSAYIPFGAGPRLCIGNRFGILEVKYLLFHLLLNFELVPTKKTPISPKIQMPSFQYSIEGGFWLGFKRIKA